MISVALINVTIVIFGLAALLLSSRARSKLSPGSIRSYIDNFSICLMFIVVFSLWQTIRSIFDFDISLYQFSGYPELIFIILAYAGFILASFRVLKISEEFGFKEQGQKIDQMIQDAEKNKAQKKRKKTKKKSKKR